MVVVVREWFELIGKVVVVCYFDSVCGIGEILFVNYLVRVFG